MIKAKIKKNVYGDYYISLEADTTPEKMLLTEVRRQEGDRGGVGFMIQGGCSAGVEDEGIDMNLDYEMTIRVNDEVRTSNPKKKRLFF